MSECAEMKKNRVPANGYTSAFSQTIKGIITYIMSKTFQCERWTESWLYRIAQMSKKFLFLYLVFQIFKNVRKLKWNRNSRLSLENKNFHFSEAHCFFVQFLACGYHINRCYLTQSFFLRISLYTPCFTSIIDLRQKQMHDPWKWCIHEMWSTKLCGVKIIIAKTCELRTNVNKKTKKTHENFKLITCDIYCCRQIFFTNKKPQLAYLMTQHKSGKNVAAWSEHRRTKNF